MSRSHHLQGTSQDPSCWSLNGGKPSSSSASLPHRSALSGETFHASRAQVNLRERLSLKEKRGLIPPDTTCSDESAGFQLCLLVGPDIPREELLDLIVQTEFQLIDRNLSGQLQELFFCHVREFTEHSGAI